MTSAPPCRRVGFRTLVEALQSAPQDTPFITAWIDEEEQETVTFGEFRHRAASYASVLIRNGVSKGDRVVIIMPQGIPATVAFVAAMIAGAVPAFLAYPNFKVEPSKYRSGLAGVTSNLNAKLVLIDEDFPDDLLQHVDLGEGTRVIRIGAPVSSPPESAMKAECDPDDIAFIQHSAGTTGLQKGVALSHRAVLTQLAHLSQALHVDTSDRVYSWLPLYHDMGLIACFMLPMVCNIHVVMQSPLDWVMRPETMLQIISNQRCTLAWLPNFAFQFVPRRSPPSRWSGCDLSSVRAFINCSEPVRAASMDEFRETFATLGLKSTALHSSYAMAENVFAVTQSDLDSGPRQIWVDARRLRIDHEVVCMPSNAAGVTALVSSGRLLPKHELRIVSDCGALLEQGHVGEILVKSDCLFDGYFNRPDLTAAAIYDGWYRTGDSGFLLDHELYVIGRKKDLLIIGGENIYPQDIEEIVSAHDSIHDGRAIAMGIYNANLGTQDIVVVAEVENELLLQGRESIEREIRAQVVAGMGVAVRTIILKPPRWIIKSTAGKSARSATREKLLREHPELAAQEEEI